MKKLIIAAAIVCAAAMSQASQFKWGTTGITDYTRSSSYSGTATLHMYLTSAGEGSASIVDSGTITDGEMSPQELSGDSIVGGNNYTIFITMEDTENNYTFKSNPISFKAPTTKSSPTKYFGSAASRTKRTNGECLVAVGTGCY